jgi:hypothetical protein
MNLKSEKWIDAAKVLIENPTATVLCPNCGTGKLRVKDVVLEEHNKCDRYMICDNCNEYNVVTFAIKQPR